jgi:transcriptional regulator with XRE-family HTH domain
MKKISMKRATAPMDKQIGLRVRTARMEAGKSQNELGVAIGVTFQQIQKYEKGVNRVSTATLHEIAKILQKPMAYFIEDGQFKPNERGAALAEFMATRQGVQLATIAMGLDETLQQTLIDIARKLAMASTPPLPAPAPRAKAKRKEPA